jgi:hypothetical protein
MTAILERNLRALSIASPKAAERIRQTPPRADLRFETSPDAHVVGIETLPPAQPNAPARERALCSLRRPLEEARAIVASVDIASSPGLVALGFGMGYHVALLAHTLRRSGILLCFEPDLGLLRAVLERVDHSAWIRQSNFALLTEPSDQTLISESVKGSEGIFTLGSALVEHPACRARLGSTLDTFASSFTHVLRAVRTSVVTTLVQSETTLRNLLMNTEHYVSCPGIDDLHNLAQGRPAIVVSAGPSLARNVELLATPGLRDRVIIIAVQTVLKDLLARGIKPHFVTALDHHEISKRFYEGLTAKQVEGITLIVEPKANPAILDSFPGPIRCVRDDWAEDLLGPRHTSPHARIQPGATVAHLAYSLARHLGCDPVILIGQDLGFTDGQYYASGAAIHNTWAPELGEFNTLEMMEWQRIARSKKLLRKLTDQSGRPIYTDEQMATYLVQFEQLFSADDIKGLTTIDATEGGVAKRHTRAMTLKDALAHVGALPTSTHPPTQHQIPLSLPTPTRRRNETNIADARTRLTQTRQEVFRIAHLSRQAKNLLQEMLRAYPDHQRVNTLIRKVEPITREVATLSRGFAIINHANQVGVLNRFKADRAIAMEADLSPIDRQHRQIERDLDNVSRIADAAENVERLLDAALGVFQGKPKLTRDLTPLSTPTPTPTSSPTTGPITTKPTPNPTPRTVAIIPVDCDRSSLGTRRRLSDPVAGPLNALHLTLARLARSTHLSCALLLTPEPDRLRQLLGQHTPKGLKITILSVDPDALAARRDRVAAARLFSPSSWRGGIANLTVYDELLHPRQLARAMAEAHADAALLLGPDWCLVDPALCDALIERHAEHPGGTRVTFTQAAPGIAPCLLARTLVDELATRQDDAQWLATIGASLGYIPIAPQSDPIAKTCCIPVDPLLRDLPGRAILDLPASRHALLPILASLGADATRASTTDLVRALAERFEVAPAGPQHLTLELCTGRLTSGLRNAWLRGRDDVAERPPIQTHAALSIISQALKANPALALTLAGAGDPLRHPQLLDILAGARALGCRAIHLRTDLLTDTHTLDTLLTAAPDVISVDLMANSRQTYRTIMGVDRFDEVTRTMTELLERRNTTASMATASSGGASGSGGGGGGLPRVWVVPRITRCDATIAEIEPFYDHWLMVAGACVIDPLPSDADAGRVQPLALPLQARTRRAREQALILSDGTLPLDGHEYRGRIAVGSALRQSFTDLWRSLWRVRRELLPAPSTTRLELQAA